MRSIAAFVMLLILSACATPHHDVLVFGTNTSLGVSVGIQPETGGNPQLSIGYRRQEAVYMPLVVNARDSSFSPFKPTGKQRTATTGVTSSPRDESDSRTDSGSQAPAGSDLLNSIKYRGTAEGSRHSDSSNHDAYSVFASFGGRGGASSQNANVQVAQFFATGVAAQRLSQSPHVASFLSTDSGDPALQRQLAEQAERIAALGIQTIEISSAHQEQVINVLQREKASAEAIVQYLCGDDPAVFDGRRASAMEGLLGHAKVLFAELSSEDCKDTNKFVDKLQSWRFRYFLEDFSKAMVKEPN